MAIPFFLVGIMINCILYQHFSKLQQRWTDATWIDVATRDIQIQRIDEYQTRMRYQVIFFLMIFVLAPFWIFPRRIEVYDNSTLNIRTLCRSYHFDEIRSIKRNSKYRPFFVRKRWDFSTDLQNRFFVARAGGRWEVWCSPSDPTGFADAIHTLDNIINHDDA